MRGGINLFLLFFPFLSLFSSLLLFFFLSFFRFFFFSIERVTRIGKTDEIPLSSIRLCVIMQFAGNKGRAGNDGDFPRVAEGEKRSRRGGEIRKNRCVLDLVRVNYVLTTAAFTILPWENNRPYVANLCGEHISYRTMSKVSVLNRGDCRFP